MNIIFLDIDGPMIPATSYVMDAHAGITRKFPAHTIAILNDMCKRGEAKIVINSTHNMDFPDCPDIITALINHGVKSEYFHENPHTEYPGPSRKEAVKIWLNSFSNPETDNWIAVDDCDFLQEYEGHEHPQMCWVDPDCGLGTKHLNQVAKYFGGPTMMVLI